jgi:hypothetical protein
MLELMFNSQQVLHILITELLPLKGAYITDTTRYALIAYSCCGETLCTVDVNTHAERSSKLLKWGLQPCAFVSGL